MNIALVGVGMGTPGAITAEAAHALASADVILGAERLLGNVPAGYPARRIALAVPDKIAAAIEEHPDWHAVCVVLSGDVGFYSGAKKLLALLHRHAPTLICGISTPQYFAALLKRPWQSFHLVSAHGVPCDPLAEVLNHREVLFLTGGSTGPGDIIAVLCQAGLGDAAVTVGENLSYPDQRLVAGTAEELAGQTFAPLSVVLVEKAKTFRRAAVAAGIDDDEFVRGKAPMTKREVRAVAMSLLRPERGAVLYDIGAGTGSVAVEMALLARAGRVYAVEREAENLELVRANREKFGAYNIFPIEGAAPDALSSLPPPDAAFVGGSGGMMREIVGALVRKNPAVRLVASAVSLESLRDALDSMNACSIERVEVIQIAVSRAVPRGGYHMMNALNPVFLIGGGGTHGA